MNSEFEQLLALLSAPVIDLLNEQESCENGNNILDLCQYLVSEKVARWS